VDHSSPPLGKYGSQVRTTGMCANESRTRVHELQTQVGAAIRTPRKVPIATRPAEATRSTGGYLAITGTVVNAPELKRRPSTLIWPLAGA
jgi:hypothetical protein